MVLFSLAGMARKNGNEEAADAYLRRIIENYPDDQYYLRALNQLAWSHYRAQRYAEAIEIFKQLVEKTPPSHERARAQFSLADAYIRVNDFGNAIRAFETLQQWLEPTADNPYGRTSAEIEKNQELLRNAMFYLGYALSRLEVPAERLAAVRGVAVRMLERFLEKYGETDLAPKAMSIIGSVYLELGDSAKASAVFDELARRYPASDEGRSAHYARISAAVELGRLDTAREAWAEVRQQPGRFSLDQLVRMGDLLRTAGLYEEAIQAYALVRANDAAERSQLEPALFGLGAAAYELKKYEESVEALNELMKRYPRSGLFYQAKFLLGRAYRELDRLPEAVAALSDVFRYADDPILINTANMELAEVQLRLARRFQQEGREAEYREQIQAALASYQRIVISGGDPKDPKIRPMIEAALAASVPLFMEIGHYHRAIEDCETYINLYPDGARLAEFRRWREEARLKTATQQPATGG
jgi:tetratricopeptide (TPR) repeat protein